MGWLGTCAGLRKLDLDGCLILTDEALEQLGEASRREDGFEFLNSDNTSDNRSGSSRGMHQVGPVPQLQLEELIISSCFKITNRGLEKLTRLQHLTYLNCDFCYQIKEEGLERLTCLKKLRSLSVSGLHIKEMFSFQLLSIINQ